MNLHKAGYFHRYRYYYLHVYLSTDIQFEMNVTAFISPLVVVYSVQLSHFLTQSRMHLLQAIDH